MAQAHSDQCVFSHDCSECRRVGRFSVGQNLYIFKQTVRLAPTDWGRAVTDWYDEVELFSREKVEPFQFSAEAGHFTALAWAETERVGCGVTSYRTGAWLASLYTCNYGPSGNLIRGQMYREGPACSRCARGWGCSAQYPGLCSLNTQNTQTNTTATTDKAGPTLECGAESTTDRALTTTTRPLSTTTKPLTPTTRGPTTTARGLTTTTRGLTTSTIALTTTARPLSTTTKPITTSTRALTTTKKSTTLRRLLFPTRTPRPVTTTRAAALHPPVPEGERLRLSCGFEDLSEAACELRGSGVTWTWGREAGGNHYYSTQLVYRDKTDLMLSRLLPPPPGTSLICVQFKYKKYSLGQTIRLVHSRSEIAMVLVFMA